MSNWAEYTAGTDPADPASYLKVEGLNRDRPVVISFGALSNRTYAVEFTDALGQPWNRLAPILARTSNRVERVTDPGYTTNRFYRVVTPVLLQPQP